MKNIWYLLIFSGLLSYGQETLHLKIEDKANKQPLTGAVIHFDGRHFISGQQGRVTIEKVKKGVFPIKVTFLGYQDYEHKITLPIDNEYVISLSEEINKLGEVVVYSDNPQRKELMLSPTLKKKELVKLQSENLAKILTSVAGVSMIQTGATIAKPVIHGLHSNRILILNNEVRQEGQQWGADHAPEIDPSITTNITIVKGSESVRYGADALGGVVLLTPKKLPYGDALHGEFSPSFASNGNRLGSVFRLESSVPTISNWAWRVQGNLKRSGDLQTADYQINNTGSFEANFSVSTGFEAENWDIEAFYSQYNNESGVFYGSHIGNLEDLMLRFETGRPLTTFPFSYKINPPKQRVTHHLAKIKGNVKTLYTGNFSVMYAYQNDIRREFNVRRGDRTEIPTLHLNLQTHSLDVSWENSLDNWNTIIGVTALQQVNYSQPGTGIVPVIPNYASIGYGGFGIAKYDFGRWLFEMGIRYDYKDLNADGYDMFGQRYGENHLFHNVTYSAGTKFLPSDFWVISSHLGASWRSPSVNELYSNGLHHGTATFDIGDTTLKSEKGFKWLNSVQFRQEKWSINADLYAQIIKNYIYDAPTGETRTLFSGVYPVFRYKQADALFRGADLEVIYSFLPRWKYGLKGSAVYAHDTNSKKYFPFIPSERISNEVTFEIPTAGMWRNFQISAGHQFVAKQHRFDPAQELVAETPSSYHLFSIGLSGELPIEKQRVTVHLSAENVLNNLYKEYTNRFRYYAHDMGRNIQLKINYSF